MFTGSLDLYLKGWMEPVIRWLLAIPGGIHFRKLALSWSRQEDISLTMALMEGCSHTLESLYISLDLDGTPIWYLCLLSSSFLFAEEPKSASFSLSDATKLKDVVFRLGSRRVKWVTLVLQTVGHEHKDLRRISIDILPDLTLIQAHVYPDVRQAFGEGIFGQSLDLGRLLVYLWESRSIRPGLIYLWPRPKMGWHVDCIWSLLPEITKRGMIERVR